MFCLKLVICDDQPADRKILHGFLVQYATQQHLEFDVLEFGSAEALLARLPALPEEPDIIFFDIYMPGMTGVEAARKLLAENFQGAFIFTTTSPDYMQEGYRIHAADYLLKPFDYSAVCAALDWCKDHLKKARKSISFVSERFDMTLYLADIVYIESCLKSTVVHARNRQLPTLKTLLQFEAELTNEPAFLKIGRGILVNFGSIKKWDEKFLYFKNGEQLCLPVRNRKKILQQIENWYWLQIVDHSS